MEMCPVQVADVVLQYVPVWPVQAEGLGCIGIDLKRQRVAKASQLQATRLTAGTSTNLKTRQF